jgi:CMP-N-acetylneuraminic acid synthetase
VVLSVCPPQKPVEWLMVQDTPEASLKPLPLQLPTTATVYYPNGAIYVTRPHWLMAGGALSLVTAGNPLVCPTVKPYPMVASQSVDVDTAEDALLAEFWLRQARDTSV